MRKQVKALFDDKKAVSPVIGVILMVAITVILAAVIGTMVMDMTEGVGNTTPTVNFEVSDHADAYGIDDGTLQSAYQIEHSDGDNIQMKNIQVVIKSADGTTIARLDSSNPLTTISNNTVELQYNGVTVDGTETVAAADTLTLVQTAEDSDGNGVFTAVGDDHQIQIIYTAGDSGSTIADSTVELQ